MTVSPAQRYIKPIAEVLGQGVLDKETLLPLLDGPCQIALRKCLLIPQILLPFAFLSYCFGSNTNRNLLEYKVHGVQVLKNLQELVMFIFPLPKSWPSL